MATNDEKVTGFAAGASHFGSVSKPGEIGNVADFLARAAIEHPQGIALVDSADGNIFTWSELDRAVNGRARWLLDQQLSKGDRVALSLAHASSRQALDYVIAFFAVCRAGLVAVPFSSEVSLTERDSFLAHSGAKLVLDEAITDPAGLNVQVVSQANGEDLAVLAYTSGTTGSPRGVMLSHRALIANVNQLAAIEPRVLKSADRVVIAAPLSHVYGLGPGLLHSVAAGATVILVDAFDGNNALDIAKKCAEQRATVLVGVPALYSALAAMSDEQLGQMLASVRHLISGAAPLSASVFSRIRRAIGLDIHQGYGLTEAAPVVTSTLVSGKAKSGSVGLPLPGIELRLVEADGAEAVSSTETDLGEFEDTFVEESGGTGFVAIRGDNLFSGYWPDGARGPSSDGWFRTGDVGYLDAEGDLHLVDRANDLITVAGFTVYPHEVESVIAELPGVVEVGVVGVPNEEATGERIKAVVLVAPGSDFSDSAGSSGAAVLSEEKIIEYCRPRLAPYKVPAAVEFVESLPHSATGKLRRLPLRG